MSVPSTLFIIAIIIIIIIIVANAVRMRVYKSIKCHFQHK